MKYTCMHINSAAFYDFVALVMKPQYQQSFFTAVEWTCTPQTGTAVGMYSTLPHDTSSSDQYMNTDIHVHESERNYDDPPETSDIPLDLGDCPTSNLYNERCFCGVATFICDAAARCTFSSSTS